MPRPRSASLTPVTLPDTIRKATGTVEISEPDGRLTLGDRQLWNHLLAHAYRTISTEEWHSVSLADIRRFAAEASETTPRNDNKRLKESIVRLQETTVQYNYLDNDQGVWESSQLLSTCRYRERDQVLEFSFPTGLRERLTEPALYSIINLRIQYAFESKYGLVLYEVLKRYSDLKAERPFWQVDVQRLRDLLGCREKLPDWKDFRRRALDPAMTEIARLGEFTVDLEEYRVGRGKGGGQVVRVTFWISRKDVAEARAAARQLEITKVQRRGEAKAAAEDAAFPQRVKRALSWLAAADFATRKRWAERAESLGVKLPPAATAPDNVHKWVTSVADAVCEEEKLA